MFMMIVETFSRPRATALYENDDGAPSVNWWMTMDHIAPVSKGWIEGDEVMAHKCNHGEKNRCTQVKKMRWCCYWSVKEK